MTNEGIGNLYTWLTVAYPLQVRPGADEEWKRTKKRDLYRVFRNYEDTEVQAAYEKWSDEHVKYPTNKDIIDIIEWHRVKTRVKASSEQTYQMNIIFDDGTEYVAEHDGKINFTWNEFLDLPRNKDRLDPDEWERRFRIRRKRVLDALYSK